jgi:hypothetical protein
MISDLQHYIKAMFDKLSVWIQNLTWQYYNNKNAASCQGELFNALSVHTFPSAKGRKGELTLKLQLKSYTGRVN